MKLNNICFGLFIAVLIGATLSTVYIGSRSSASDSGRNIELSLEDGPVKVCVHHGDLGRHCFDMDKLALLNNSQINDGHHVSKSFSADEPYSNHNLHLWACNTALKYDEENKKTGGGCYDVCSGLADWVTPAKPIKGFDPRYAMKPIPLLVDTEFYGDDIVNACAIVLSGAEW